MQEYKFSPAYKKLLQSGELKQRAIAAQDHLSICDVCAWRCPVNRREGHLGVCKTGIKAMVSSYGAHMGEENPLRGYRGSGTIFFTRCNLRCQYCQNYQISQKYSGEEIGAQELAAMMLELQAFGCHNINLVSPSHVVPQIISAVLIAAQAGLTLPLVYNTGGYDSLSMLKMLEDIVDIYMPDMKYADPVKAKKYSRIPDYPRVNQEAVLEMHRQVGNLLINPDGIAIRGLLIRHLILPNDLADTEEIIDFIANMVSKETYLNLMDQYHPAYRAHLYPELNRRISKEEYRKAIDHAHKAGLTRLDDRRPIF